MVKYIRNYYGILGLNMDASKKEIQLAYKRLIKKHSKQDLVEEAYLVLSDDTKRKNYDKLFQKSINNKKEKRKGKVNIKDSVDQIRDLEDNYSVVSKLFKTSGKSMMGKGLLTGPNIIMGGLAAGYGIKKGRDYMKKRGKNQE